MKTRYKFRKKSYIVVAALLAMVIALSACSGSPKPTPAATAPVSVADGSFDDGRALGLGFTLLYGLDSSGGNGMLGTAGIAECLTAIENGAAGDTDLALTNALGIQGMTPKQINENALHLRQAIEKLKVGRFATAWSLFIGEQQAIKESYLTDCDQSLQMNAVFQQLNNQTGNKVLGEWADENTGGRVKKVNFKIPVEKAPFFVDITMADPDWQTALDTGKSRPLPFKFEDGEAKAVPTMVVQEKCGIYTGPEGSMAILPTSGDETRLVIMVPPEKMTLHDFIPIAAAKHDEWMDKAEWKSQRVLLPRFQLSFEGSILKVLDKSGFAGLITKKADYTNLGESIHFSDILHKSSLIIDESGIDSPDPDAMYRQGLKDDMPTLAVDRPFVVALEKTDGLQVLVMGFVRDPLAAAIN